MTNKKLKAVLILGPDHKNILQEIIALYNNSDFLLIGNGERDITIDDLIELYDKIDENTRIDILVHGQYVGNQHRVKLSSNFSYSTEELFDALKIISNSIPLHIHLWSCYAGLAGRDISSLSDGSVLITHAHNNETSNIALSIGAIKEAAKNIVNTQKIYSPFQSFLSELALNCAQTNMLKAYFNYNIHTFKVNLPLKDIIHSPEKFLLHMAEKFKEFYIDLYIRYSGISIYLENDNLSIPNYSITEIEKFQLGCLIYKCQNADVQTIRFLSDATVHSDEIVDIITNKHIANIALLHMAVLDGYTDIVSLLCDKYKINVNKFNSKIWGSPLTLAAENGHFKVAKLLLKYGANVDYANYHGETPLFTASAKNDTELVKLLTQYDAHIDKATDNKVTPLYIASQNGYTEVVKLLLQNGAYVDKVVYNDITPLYVACQAGHFEVAKLLLKYGANVDYAIPNGATALFIASENNYIELVQLLLQQASNVDIALSKYKLTPLYIASRDEYIEVVKLLLEYGANVNKAIHNDITPLYMASQKGYAEVVKLLLQYGANVHQAVKSTGATPLAIATCLEHVEIIILLLQNHADPVMRVGSKQLSSIDVINQACPDKLYILQEVMAMQKAFDLLLVEMQNSYSDNSEELLDNTPMENHPEL